MLRHLLARLAAGAVFAISGSASAQSLQDLAQMANVVYDKNPQAAFASSCTGEARRGSRRANKKISQIVFLLVRRGT